MNVLNMQWTSSSGDTFTFEAGKVKHGDTPTASSSSLSSGGSDVVTAKQSTNVTPGPEGTYEWESPDAKVTCEYHFPAGQPPQQIQIWLTPQGKVEVSFDGSNWYSDKAYKSWNSTSTTQSVTCYVRGTSKS